MQNTLEKRLFSANAQHISRFASAPLYIPYILAAKVDLQTFSIARILQSAERCSPTFKIRMAKRKKTLILVSIALLILTGVNAVVAGFLFIMDPSGVSMGMSLDYLRFSPFQSFLVPGIVLFAVNGMLNLFAAFYTLKQRTGYAFWIVLQGVLLCGWILIQVLMVRDVNILHLSMLAIGLTLLGCGIALIKMLQQEASHAAAGK